MLLASPDISKDDLITIITTQILDHNPEDVRTLDHGQMAIHPGMVIELKRLRSKMGKMSAEDLRLVLLRGNFDFCEG